MGAKPLPFHPPGRGTPLPGRREGGIVDLKKDIDVVEEARKMALTILEKDPKLTWEEHKNLGSGSIR